MTFSITQKSQAEFARYNACAQGRERRNCDPSLVWVMNGWSLVQATSTSVVSSTSMGAVMTGPVVPATTSTQSAATSTPAVVITATLNGHDLLTDTEGDFPVSSTRPLVIVAKTVGKKTYSMTAKVVLAGQDEPLVQKSLVLQADSGAYRATISLPASVKDLFNVHSSFDPAYLILTVKDSKGAEVQVIKKLFSLIK